MTADELALAVDALEAEALAASVPAYPRLLAIIESRPPPEGPLTLAAWREWRRAEDERMLNEAWTVLLAAIQREAGATVH